MTMVSGAVLALAPPVRLDPPGSQQATLEPDDLRFDPYERAGGGIFTVDSSGAVTSWSLGAERRFGVGAHEAHARPVQALIQFAGERPPPPFFDYSGETSWQGDALVHADGEVRIGFWAQRTPSAGSADAGWTVVFMTLGEEIRGGAGDKGIAQQLALAQMGRRALEGATVDELSDQAVAAVLGSLGASSCWVLHRPDPDAQLEMVACAGDVKLAFDPNDELDRCTPIGAVLDSGEASVTALDCNSGEDLDLSLIRHADGFLSTITVPIRGAGEITGILSASADPARPFAPQDVPFLESIANIVADSVERSRVIGRLEHQALHDPLTGLPNRASFLRSLARALISRESSGRGVAVLFVDLDHFKAINDVLGHAAGDDLLRQVAARLQLSLRPRDLVARLSGDEFAVMCRGIDPEDVAQVGARITTTLMEPFTVAGSARPLTCSVGVAVAQGRRPPAALLGDADAAMYQAKTSGRNRYAIFDERTQAMAVRRLQIESELRLAVERDELRLDFQPVMDLRTSEIVSVEALLRWSPSFGPVEPAEFIPIAEAAGIVELALWIVREAAARAADWNKRFERAIPVAVNVSPSELTEPFVAVLLEAVDQHGLDPRLLTVEVTERVLMAESNLAAELLGELRRHGVKLVLDDFGTGYSSLNYLASFEFDGLKLDKSFVIGHHIGDRDSAIVMAVIGLARVLDLALVAEGIETTEQRDWLLGLGCTLGQGYLLGRPMSAADFEATLVRPH